MKSVTSHDPSCTKAGLFRILLGISCAVALVACLPQISHAQGCQIGFQPGSPITDANITGNPAAPLAKWADASTIQSGFPCMDYLYDWDVATKAGGHAMPTLQKSVTVFSKRDGANLYMGFRVLDQTQNRQDLGHVGEQLLIGVRVIRLRERVPGKKYDIGFMLQGVAQHGIYHAGQIAILKKTRL